MAAYSMDLRQRVLRAWDQGLDAESVAAKYEVSRAWVHRLVQRRRETGGVHAEHDRRRRARQAEPVLVEQQQRRGDVRAGGDREQHEGRAPPGGGARPP